jgi:hypothetical protein
MKSRWAVAVVLVVLVAAGIAVVQVLRAGGGGSSGEFTSKGGARVFVTTPKSDSVVSSPLTIRGKVPGSWSFEANFGVEILDADRASVATTYATVHGDWMTEKDVNFTASVRFDPPKTKTGFLVLRKANPSDIEGKADSVAIPIRFR